MTRDRPGRNPGHRLTVRRGFSEEEGLPNAMQFMGRRLSEPMLLCIGHTYESAAAWHERRSSV